MDKHVRNLGVLSMAFGLVSIVGSVGVLYYFGSITSLFNHAEDAAGVGLLAVALVIAHLIIGPPFIGAGKYVMRYEHWARSSMMVLCGVALLLIPFGSMLAIYGLWVLLTPETEPLFTSPPGKSNRQRR